MRKLLLSGAMLLCALWGKAQFTQNDLIYYVGDGPDTAVIVIDFLDGTVDSSYAWGYLFDATASITGGDALAAISADEQKLNVVTGGGFLNDIFYNAHQGLGGDPNYWGTWSRTGETSWVTNGGLTEVLANGDWFGCSYTDFDPAITPGEPLPAYASAKYDTSMVEFWVGTGSDSAVLVIDFVSSLSGEAMTYAWGYLFDGTTDGATMLADIDAADPNLQTDAGPFLNDILYNGLAGLAADPDYWATWSGTNLSDWTMNAGLATSVSNGDWFGCSYAAWPSRRPFYPISALDSAAVSMEDVEFVSGTGANRVVLIIDFNEWLPGHSYSFGYSFDSETITASEVMEGLEDVGFFGLGFNLDGGFLNDVVYGVTGESGIGGDPNYWSTWSATNVGGWEINTGIGEVMTDGDWFGCSYTAWSPATPPSLPESGFILWGIDETTTSAFSVFPNPAIDQIRFTLENESVVQIVDLQGRVILQQNGEPGLNTLPVDQFNAGVYFMVAQIQGESVKTRFIIQ